MMLILWIVLSLLNLLLVVTGWGFAYRYRKWAAFWEKQHNGLTQLLAEAQSQIDPYVPFYGHSEPQKRIPHLTYTIPADQLAEMAEEWKERNGCAD